jgi:putative two-component system response regulator
LSESRFHGRPALINRKPYADGTNRFRCTVQGARAPAVPMISPAPTVRNRTATRVLVVDDEPATLAAVQAILGGAGFEVTTLADLAHARAALEHHDFDLVLTDLYLDEKLGFELAEAAMARRPPVPVILMTGRPSFDGAQRAVQCQVCEIVTKPIEAHRLIAACKRTLSEWRLRQRNRELEAQNDVLAKVLPRAIEVRDPTTKGHSDRVVTYSDNLARRCGVGEAERASLRTASLLHDVGKIGVPTAILAKEGPLTNAERDVIKRHPRMGYEILEPMVDSEDARCWVLQHHERWDGRGYPDGLRGDEVALPGRILILAEVYDALAETRSYKSAWEVGRIVEFFRAEAGKHFDPDLAQMAADGLEREGKRYFAARAGELF